MTQLPPANGETSPWLLGARLGGIIQYEMEAPRTSKRSSKTEIDFRAWVALILSATAIVLTATASPQQASPRRSTSKASVRATEPPELSFVSKAVENTSNPAKALADALESAGDDSERIFRALTDVIRQFPTHSDAYYTRVALGFCQNNTPYPTVLNDLNDAIRFLPSGSDREMVESPRELYTLRSKVEYDLGDHRKALDDLEYAVRLDPHSAGTLFDEHVVVTAETKSLPCAWTPANFRDLEKEFPSDYRIHLFAGLWYEFHAFYDHQHYGPARLEFQKAVAANPKSGLAYYYLGQIIEATLPDAEKFSQTSQPTETDRKLLDTYGTALALDPTLVPAYTARANIHIYLKHPALALRDYNEAIKLHPKDHEIYNRRAQLLTDNGKNEEAVEDFTKAIANCTDWGLLRAYYEQRGDVSVRIGAFRDAIQDYSQSIRLLLENVVPHMLGLHQFRKLYPEYNAVDDGILSKKLQTVLRPAWDYDVFSKGFLETGDETSVASELFENYSHRGDAYWLSKNYRKALADYQRILNGLPQFIKDYPDMFERWKPFFVVQDGIEYIDVRTVDLQNDEGVKLWVKGVVNTAGKPSTSSLQETHINCVSRSIRVLSSTKYDSKGTVIGAVSAGEWSSILPDTLGEALYDGMCKE